LGVLKKIDKGKMIARRVILIIFAAALLLFTSGCATVPRKAAVREGLSSQTIKIDGKDYLPVTVVAMYYQMKWEWDPVAKKAELNKGEDVLAFYVGMEYAVVNRKLERLSSSVVFYDGAVAIPADFATRRIAEILGPPKTAIRHPPEPTQKYTVRKVVVDAGHGGMDPGAIGRSGLKEKDVTLDMVRRIKDELGANGIDVILTRDRDKFVSLSGRTRIANDNDVDFFVSIHANANRSRSIRGFEVYYLSDAVDDTARAAEAAENSFLKVDDSSFYVRNTDLEATVWDLVYTENREESIELAKYIAKSVDNSTSLKNRGVRGARFYVLKGAQMPSVLVEVGYISNAIEERNLKDKSYRQAVASAVARGILNYKKVYESTDGFTR
jgi:N-acetylmuramoyl-L-alanine amidase